MTFTARILVLLPFFITVAQAQVEALNSPRLSPQGSFKNVPPSNSITHIAPEGTTVYVGTSKGLARTADGGATWESFRSVPQFANDGIFSLAVRGNVIWTATGFNKPLKDEPNRTVQTGSGYTYCPAACWNDYPRY